MGAERKATVTYTGDGTQTKYSFPFDYLRKAFVKVQDIAGDAITELTLGTDYSIDDKQVTLTKAIPSGNHLKIYRQTTTEPLVEWQDASVLRSADLSLQEVQLLHLSEETLDRVQEGGMATDPDDTAAWDARFKRVKNLLDPKDDGDAMTLRYAKNTTNGMITNITNTGDTQVKRVTTTGDSQVKRVTDEGNTQNTRVTTTGDTYVTQMTSLKDTATTKATEASNSADLSKAWAVSKSSPDGTDSMSSLSWAEASRISAANAKTSETNAKASAAKAATSEASAETYMEHASASEVSAGDSAKAAKTSETNAATSATNAASSAESAKASAEAAKLYDPSVKQDKLTFDTTPTEGSTNPVTSDGIKKAINSGVLSGIILAFSGTFSTDGYPINITTGNADKSWHLCDGSLGTPDLRGRFILGASDAHAKGTTGGEEETGLSIANLPPHSFSGVTSDEGQHDHNISAGQAWSAGAQPARLSYRDDKGLADFKTDAAGLHHHTFTTNTLGEGTKHNNMPPFYTLSYIMKL